MSCRGSRFVPFWSILADVMSQSSLGFSNKKNREVESPCGEAGRRLFLHKNTNRKHRDFSYFCSILADELPRSRYFFPHVLGKPVDALFLPLGAKIKQRNQHSKSNKQSVKFKPKNKQTTKRQTTNQQKHKPEKSKQKKNNNTHLTPHALGKPKPIGRSADRRSRFVLETTVVPWGNSLGDLVTVVARGPWHSELGQNWQGWTENSGLPVGLLGTSSTSGFFAESSLGGRSRL